ncbi:unnamed protein product [Gadus morhua 'NCC']
MTFILFICFHNPSLTKHLGGLLLCNIKLLEVNMVCSLINSTVLVPRLAEPQQGRKRGGGGIRRWRRGGGGGGGDSKQKQSCKHLSQGRVANLDRLCPLQILL